MGSRSYTIQEMGIGTVMAITSFSLLVWWIGPEPMLVWRRANVDTFLSLHPECVLLDEYVHAEIDSDQWKNRYVLSDNRRRDWCKGGPYRLWIDSDVEARRQFPLGDLPAMADEGFPHWSICWSGNRPDVFDVDLITRLGPVFSRKLQLEEVTLIPQEFFIHWGTTADGEKKDRKWGRKRKGEESENRNPDLCRL